MYKPNVVAKETPFNTFRGVSYDATNKVYKYCIQIIGSKRVIGKSSCLDSESLTGIDVVKDK